VKGSPSTAALERLVGIVERVTYVNPHNGWSVIKVSPMGEPHRRVAVVLHQVAVVPGATMEFCGNYQAHPRFGEQFKCLQALERKPASAAALQRYLGSGMIRGVGPKTAKKIVRHFGGQTLEVFEDDIERLTEVRGIAARKLEAIAASWREHRAIRDVMLFLTEHGVSTLFAVRIFKRYGDHAIETVKADPYRLARDIYGIGFFSADAIAKTLGFDPLGLPRVRAGVRHVLSASREAGHCYLLGPQVDEQVATLLDLQDPPSSSGVPDAENSAGRRLVREALAELVDTGDVRTRVLDSRPPATDRGGDSATDRAAYYARTLFDAEETVARSVSARAHQTVRVDHDRVQRWLRRHGERASFGLSAEQHAAVVGTVTRSLSVLTGGPGCGKTTTLRALVELLTAMGRRVVLAAPTGRAAQRMSEVIGTEAKTLHRVLEWDPSRGAFRHDAQRPLSADFVVVDEVSMLDVLLAAALLSAVPASAQILLIGDPYQLPSVGPGRVLADLLASPAVPRYELRQVFRQAESSAIVADAHAIRRGDVPDPPSPVRDPTVWSRGDECLFVDSDVATQQEVRFVRRAKAVMAALAREGGKVEVISDDTRVGTLHASSAGHVVQSPGGTADEADEAAAETFSVPRRFLHVDLAQLARTDSGAQELAAVLRRVHPDSTLHHGLTLPETIVRLFTHTVPQQLGPDVEVQVLAPMNRGSVGAAALNVALQQAANPPSAERGQIVLGDRVLRVGDRVIQKRNDYDLGVFNGDIGRIASVDAVQLTVDVDFGDRVVTYSRDALAYLSLAYAITVHKSQGSEFPVVIVPVVMQHFTMLFRDLIYTALTRARRLAVFVGSRTALRRAVANTDSVLRQTALSQLLGAPSSTAGT
jgi:exodeoxyribonuclease V alpha subunit